MSSSTCSGERAATSTLAKALLAFVVLACGMTIDAHAAVGKGAQALLAPEVAAGLQLTDAQKQQIQTIVSVTSKKFQETQASLAGNPGRKGELEKLRQAAQDEAVALLSKEQRAVWDRLVNEPAGATPTTLPAPTGPERTGKTANPADDEIATRSLLIPTIAEMKHPPSREAYGPSSRILETRPRPPMGTSYVVLTDRTEPKALAALQRLADFRHGTIVTTDSLGLLYQHPEEFARVRAQLRNLAPRYVAIAPQPASYRENMHLCMLKLLWSLDDQPGLAVFPGYLVADDAAALEKLVDRTIAFQPITRAEIKPVTLGTIEDDDTNRYRSYQKAKVLQKMFAGWGRETPAILLVTNPAVAARPDFPKLDGSEEIAMMPAANRRRAFPDLSPPVKAALSGRNVLMMFGHGLPSHLCGTEVSAFTGLNFSNELVFCGSCMSESPAHADRVNLEKDAAVKRFGTVAMDQGAVMVLGHMGLCGGFPEVYPMAEQVFDGRSVGEAYQQVLNALIGNRPIGDYYPAPPPALGPRNSEDKTNSLLLMLWADPALTPIKAEAKTAAQSSQ